MKSTRQLRKILTTSIAAAVATFAATREAQAASGTWGVNAAGNWSVGTNWAGGTIADGATFTANFTFDINADRIVTLDTVRTIGNLLFTDASNNYTIAGTNVLTLDAAAASSISMTNAGRTAFVNVPLAGLAAKGIVLPTTSLGIVSLGSNASTFNGQVTISNGATLQLGAGAATAGVAGSAAVSNTSLGLGGAGNETIVQAGGVLNINGQNTGNLEIIRIAGFGNATLAGAALVNNTTANNNALSTVVLTADAAIGGGARFDIRNNVPLLDLAGFRLTKIGTNQFSVVNGSITDGNIDVTAGTLSVEANALVQGTRTITLNTGGTLGLWTNVAGQFTRQIVLAGGAINELGSASATSTQSSRMVLASNTTVTVNAAATVLTLAGSITQSGGSFGLTKTAPGTLVLAGKQSWSGPLTIADAGGQVRLGPDGALQTRNISIGDGSSFDASATGGHSIGAGGTLTVGSAIPATNVTGNFTALNGSTITVGANFAVRTATFANDLSITGTALNMDLDFSASDSVVVAGNLTAFGTNAITLRPASNSGFGAGPYTLFSSTNLIGGAANFSIANAANFRQIFTIDTTSVPNSVLLNVTGGSSSIIWQGASAGGAWDINTTANWAFGTDRFYDTDSVNFADGGAPNVDLKTVVAPSNIFVNATQNYTFGGKGRISGPTGIVKSGTGTLTLANDKHDFTGQVSVDSGGTISGGLLSNNGVAGSFGASAAALPISLDNGTLEYTGGTITSNKNLTIGGGGGTIAVAEPLGVLTLSTAITGSGALNKSGPGILAISAVVGFAGDINVNAGVLRPTTATALGTKIVNVAFGATFDPNGQTGVSATRPTLNIQGFGVPGAAAIWNGGAALTNAALYGTVNLTGDAVIGTPVRYDLNGGTGGLNFNASTYSLQLVGTGEKWWAPNPGAVLNDVIVRHGLFGVQLSNNMASDGSILNSAIYVLPAGQLATFGDGITNTKAVILSGGTLASTGGGGTNGQFWRGGVSLNGNSFFDNRGTAVASQITIDNLDPTVAPLTLNGLTLEKLGSAGPLILANAGGSATGTGNGTLRIYNGGVTIQNGFIMDGTGQVRIQNFGQLNLNNTGIAPVLSKEVKLDGGTLNNAAGDNSTGPIVVGAAQGRIFNSAASNTFSLGDITVSAGRGIQFGTTGAIVLSTINLAPPVTGAGGRLGVDYTAGATAATTGFATWNGSVVGTLGATVTNTATPTILDDALYTVLTTLDPAADRTTNTLVTGADVVIPTGRLFTVASGGIVMRGADHSINTPALGTGRLTTGAADGRLVVNTPETIEQRGALHIRAQMVDTPVGAGFRMMTVQKNGPGQATQWGTDNGANMLNNLYSGGTVINNGRVVPNGTLALGTGRVTINDGGQLATFNMTGAAGQATYIHNNVTVTGRGAGESAGYLGAIRVGTNSNMSGSITVSDVTRIHNQNGQGTLSGILKGTGTLQHTGNNITWITNPASTFSGVNEFGFRDQTGAIQILVSKLANGGQPSSIGASSSAASNIIFNINPILRYVGIGDSTDRLFTLAGGFNIGGTPGAIIDGSGYGGINFTNTGNIAFGPGSYRQLTLRASTLGTGATTNGDNLPLNTFAPNLGDPSDHGFGQLVKDGVGRWVITANHTYSGITTVTDGILILGNGGTSGMFGNGAGGLGPNQVNINNSASVQLNRSDSYTIANNLVSSNANGNTEVVQLGGGTVTLTGANDNSSTRLRVENGVLELAKKSSTAVHSAALLATIGAGGTLRLAGTGDDQIFDGATNGIWTTVQMNGGTFDLNGRDEAVYRVEGTGTITNSMAGMTGTLTVGGSLAGVGNGASRTGGGLGATITDGAGVMALTKVGTGTIALTGTSSHTGGTAINGGTLSIGNGGTTGSLGSGTVSIGSAGTLAVNRSNAFTVTNTLTGGGGLTQQGSGTTTVNAPLGYTGPTTVNAGVLDVNLSASNDVLPAVGRLVLNGGAAKFTGGAGGTSAQTVAEFHVAGGDVIVDGTAGLTTLNLPGTFTRLPGGSVNFATIGTTTINSTVTNVNGILGLATAAYATVNGTDWAAGSGAAIVPFAGYTADTYLSGTHTDVVASGAVPIGSTSTIRLNTPAVPALTLAGSLVVEQGGILITPLMGATTITGGTLTGGAAMCSEIVVHQHTTGGTATATQISSIITNNGGTAIGLTKAGPGILALTGANIYSGETHVNQGILSVGAFGTTGTLGTGAVINDAILAFARTNTLVVDNVIGGNGQVVQAGGGTVQLNAPNTFTGGLLVSAGTVRSDRGFAPLNPTTGIFGLGGSSTFALSNTDTASGAGSGTVTLGDGNTGASAVAFLSDGGADFSNPIVVTASGTGTATIGSNSGPTASANPAMFVGTITLNRATTFQSNNADRTTYLGSIGGNPGTVTITGTTAGTNAGGLNRTTWENDNPFTGNVVIAANSTLQVGTGAFAAPRNQIPDTADVTLNATSYLTLNGDSETIGTLNSTATNSQIQSAAGGGQTLRVLNGGTFNGIFNGGNNTGMTIDVAGGTMIFGGTADNATGRIRVSGGTAVLGKVSANGVHANAVDLTINTGGTALIGGTFTGALPTNYGTGVVLPGNYRDQIFDGATGASSSVVINGGTLDLGGFSEGLGRLDGTGGLVTNSAAATTSTLYVGTQSISNLFTAGFYGNIQDGAGIVALGKVTNGISIFAGDLTHTGGTSIYAGTLQIGNGGNSGTISGSVNLVNANTASLVFNRGGTALIPASISGGGPVISNGDGVVKFTGANTYTGTTTINAGVLQIGDGGTSGTLGTGNVTNCAVLAFNRTDLLVVPNAITGSAGSLVRQDGTGTTTINGALNFPQLDVNDGRLNLDSTLANAVINDNNGILNVNADATNSTVNVSDRTFFLVSQNLAALNIGPGGVAVLGGPAGAPAPAFDGGDFASGGASLGAGDELGGSAVQGVPEPGALTLLALGALSLLGRRRRA